MSMSERSDRPLYGLFGIGGFGRPVMPILIENVRSRHGDDADVVFVENEPASSQLNGVQIVSTESFLKASRDKVYFNVALADPHARKAACERFLASGLEPVSIISPLASILGPAEIGAGAIICGFCTITTNVRIGDFFHANIYSYVEHDCVIGDYVTFAPRVGCNGNISVGDLAYVGAAAVIRQGNESGPVTIGRGATVGMGAVVLTSVADGDTVAGNPAKSIRTVTGRQR
jgi:sugar O-acyltransferase (sialic acid O-acetyltransferase NeuD family)